MGDPKYRFRVEMTTGQEQRQIDADSYREEFGWLMFYRNPPQGGKVEFWRVRLDHVVCIHTALTDTKVDRPMGDR